MVASVMVRNRSLAFSTPSAGRLPVGTWTMPVRRNGGSPIWARTERFGMRISGRCGASDSAVMTSSAASMLTSTCMAPTVADGSAYSLIVAASRCMCVLAAWLAMSATRANRVIALPETR